MNSHPYLMVLGSDLRLFEVYTLEWNADQEGDHYKVNKENAVHAGDLTRGHSKFVSSHLQNSVFPWHSLKYYRI